METSPIPEPGVPRPFPHAVWTLLPRPNGIPPGVTVFIIPADPSTDFYIFGRDKDGALSFGSTKPPSIPSKGMWLAVSDSGYVWHKHWESIEQFSGQIVPDPPKPPIGAPPYDLPPRDPPPVHPPGHPDPRDE